MPPFAVPRHRARLDDERGSNVAESPTASEIPGPMSVSAGSDAPEVTIRGRLKSGTGIVLLLLGMATLGGLLFVTVSPRAEANPRNAAHS